MPANKSAKGSDATGASPPPAGVSPPDHGSSSTGVSPAGHSLVAGDAIGRRPPATALRVGAGTWIAAWQAGHATCRPASVAATRICFWQLGH